jgi:hypothetical protein
MIRLRVALAHLRHRLFGHWYLSTHCLHGQHDVCGAMQHQRGDTLDAHCKNCPAPCRCPEPGHAYPHAFQQPGPAAEQPPRVHEPWCRQPDDHHTGWCGPNTEGDADAH